MQVKAAKYWAIDKTINLKLCDRFLELYISDDRDKAICMLYLQGIV